MSSRTSLHCWRSTIVLFTSRLTESFSQICDRPYSSSDTCCGEYPTDRIRSARCVSSPQVQDRGYDGEDHGSDDKFGGLRHLALTVSPGRYREAYPVADAATIRTSDASPLFNGDVDGFSPLSTHDNIDLSDPHLTRGRGLWRSALMPPRRSQQVPPNKSS